MKTIFVILFSLFLVGCATHAPTQTRYTHQPNQDVYNTRGQRVATIDTQGNVYSTQGTTAGRRIARISK